MLPKLLHPAHVEPPVPFGNVQHQQVEDLALLHHRQLQLGPGEALGVVAVETRLPHVDAGDEDLVFRSLGGGGQEGPFDHGQGGVSAPLGHDAGQRHVLALLGHGEGGGRDGDVDGVANICKEKETEDDVCYILKMGFGQGSTGVEDFQLVPCGLESTVKCWKCETQIYTPPLMVSSILNLGQLT